MQRVYSDDGLVILFSPHQTQVLGVSRLPEDPEAAYNERKNGSSGGAAMVTF